jgi:transposase-like protein/IS1 family transposase
MQCSGCGSSTQRYGKDKYGNQRFRCQTCRRTFIASKKAIRLERSKALLCLRLLVEGNSVRSTEKITGVHRDTILNLVTVVGSHCDSLMNAKIRNISFERIEADEIWGFVQKKEGHKTDEETSNTKIGDAYTFVGIEARSKLIACFVLGRRDLSTTFKFIQKLARAAGPSFQLTTDGFPAYRDAVEQIFGIDIDFAQLIKEYRSDETGEHRYSPGAFVRSRKAIVTGNPDISKISTSSVERQNLTMRMSMRRLTRLTNGFSKKWENLEKTLALHFAYYNFCRIHQALRVTPAMEAGIEDHIWDLEELVRGVL